MGAAIFDPVNSRKVRLICNFDTRWRNDIQCNGNKNAHPSIIQNVRYVRQIQNNQINSILIFHDVTYSRAMNKNFTAYDLFVYFVSLISYLVDVGSGKQIIYESFTVACNQYHQLQFDQNIIQRQGARFIIKF